MSYTCETADYFRLYQVQSRIEAFEADMTKAASEKRKCNSADKRFRFSLRMTDVVLSPPCTAKASIVSEKFPFKDFFSTAPQPLFGGKSFADDLETAEGCFCHLNKVFEELEDYRAFELLRNQTMRGDYLLTKQVSPLLESLLPLALICTSSCNTYSGKNCRHDMYTCSFNTQQACAIRFQIRLLDYGRSSTNPRS